MGNSLSGDSKMKAASSQPSDEKWLNFTTSDINNPEVLVKECSKLSNVIRNETPLPVLPELSREQLRLRNLYVNKLNGYNQFINDLKSFKENVVPTEINLKDTKSHVDEGKFTMDDLIDSFSTSQSQDIEMMKVKSYLDSYLYLDSSESSSNLFQRLRTRALVRIHKAVCRQSLFIQSQSGTSSSVNNSKIEDYLEEDILKSKYGWKIFFEDVTHQADQQINSLEVVIASSLSMNVANLSAILELPFEKSGTLRNFLYGLINIYNSTLTFNSTNVIKNKSIQADEIDNVVLSFDKDLSYSGTSFHYSINNKKVTSSERIGVSYPAALCELTKLTGSFTVQILHPKSNAMSFTFGIAKKDLSNSSSAGFGKEVNSWGIVSSSSSSTCYENGVKMIQSLLPTINSGDVFSIIYNIDEGWADLLINFKFITKFILIKNLSYTIGVTLGSGLSAYVLPFTIKNLILFSENISSIPTSWEIPKCSKGHSLNPQMTNVYSNSTTIICDVCSARPINSHPLPYFHCADNCNWDLCFTCSLPPENDKSILFPESSVKSSNSNQAKVVPEKPPSEKQLLKTISFQKVGSPVWLSIEQLIALLRDKCLSYNEENAPDSKIANITSKQSKNLFEVYSLHKYNQFVQNEMIATGLESIKNLSLSVMFQLSLFRSSLQGILEVIHYLISSTAKLVSHIKPSLRLLFKYSTLEDFDKITSKLFLEESTSIYQASIIMKLLADYSRNIDLSNPLFVMSSTIEYEYLLNLIDQYTATNYNDCNISIYALQILYYNIEVSIRPLTSKEKNNFLNVPVKSITYYNFVSSDKNENLVTCLDKINHTLKSILSDPTIDPEKNLLGEFAVKIACLRDVMYPNSSIQFKAICQLLSKNENKMESPCEKYLITMMMKDLEGKSMLELINSSDSFLNSSENVCNENFNFICSLLSILKKILLNKWDSFNNFVSDCDSFMFQSINKVLETLTMQYISSTINNYLNVNNNVSTSIILMNSIVELVKQLIVISIEILKDLLDKIGKFDEISSESLLYVDNIISQSYIGSLIPTLLASIVLFWKECYKSITVNELQLLTDLAKNEISELIKIVKKYSLINSKYYIPAEKVVQKPATSNAIIQSSSDNIAVDLSSYVTISIWDVNISDNALTFSDNNISCRRPGSASCYPAALALVPSQYSIFNVILSETNSQTNWLSVGFGKRNFPISNSDGFGRSSDSWGIADDRSRDSECSFFAYNGTKVQTAPRKLKLNDIITIILNLEVGSLEICVNFGEFSHIFGPDDSKSYARVLSNSFKSESSKITISSQRPVGSPSDFVFGATFANDHKLSIHTLTPEMKISPSILSISKQTESWTARIKYDVHEYECLLVSSFLYSNYSKDIVDIDIMKCLNSNIFYDRVVETDTQNSTYNLLKKLTDAPNGLDNGNTLVTIMKRHVLQDRGKESRSNHLVHAVCAALLWHCSQYDDCIDLIDKYENKVTVVPSKAILDCWKFAQNLRSIKHALNDNNAEEGVGDEIPHPPKMLRQYSLPIPNDSSYVPLDDFSLAAVRRARFLLEFKPVCDKNLTYSNFLKLSKEISDFVLEGPDVDKIRLECARRDLIAKNRIFGFDYIYHIASNIDISDYTLYTSLMKTVIRSRRNFCKEYFSLLVELDNCVHHNIGLNGSNAVYHDKITFSTKILFRLVIERLQIYIKRVLDNEWLTESLLSAILVSFQFFTFAFTPQDAIILSELGFIKLLTISISNLNVPIIRYISYCLVENILQLSADFLLKNNNSSNSIDNYDNLINNKRVIHVASNESKLFELIIYDIISCITTKIQLTSKLYTFSNKAVSTNSDYFQFIYSHRLVIDRSEVGLKIPLQLSSCDNNNTDCFSIIFNLYRYSMVNGTIFSFGDPVIPNLQSLSKLDKENLNDKMAWSGLTVDLSVNGFVEVNVISSIEFDENDPNKNCWKYISLKSFSPIQLSKWSNVVILVNNKEKTIALFIDYNIECSVTIPDYMSKALMSRANIFDGNNIYIGQQVDNSNLVKKKALKTTHCAIENLVFSLGSSISFTSLSKNYSLMSKNIENFNINDRSFFNYDEQIKNSYVTIRPNRSRKITICIKFNRIEEDCSQFLSIGYFTTYSYQNVYEYIEFLKTETSKVNNNKIYSQSLVFGKTLGTVGLFHQDNTISTNLNINSILSKKKTIQSNDRAIICFDYENRAITFSLFDDNQDLYFEVSNKFAIACTENEKSVPYQYYHVGVSIGKGCDISLVSNNDASLSEVVDETSQSSVEVVDNVITTWDTPHSLVELEFMSESATVFNSQSSSLIQPSKSTCICSITSPRSSVSFLLLSCVLMGDLLSFGLFKKLSSLELTNESFSNGFGKSESSIGITNKRIDGVTNPCEVCAFNNISTLTECPQLAEGDIVTIAVDFTRIPAVLIIKVNSKQFVFKIPVKSKNDYEFYCFGVTVALQHELAIVPDSNILTEMKSIVFESEETTLTDNNLNQYITNWDLCLTLQNRNSCLTFNSELSCSDLLRSSGIMNRYLNKYKSDVKIISRSSLSILSNLQELLQTISFNNSYITLRIMFTEIFTSLLLYLKNDFELTTLFDFNQLYELNSEDNMIYNIIHLIGTAMNPFSLYYNNIQRQLLSGIRSDVLSYQLKHILSNLINSDANKDFRNKFKEILSLIYTTAIEDKDYSIDVLIGCYYIYLDFFDGFLLYPNMKISFQGDAGLVNNCTVLKSFVLDDQGYLDDGIILFYNNIFNDRLDESTKKIFYEKTEIAFMNCISILNDNELTKECFLHSADKIIKVINKLLLTDTIDTRPLDYLLIQSKPEPTKKVLTFESPHPYADNTDDLTEISIPGAKELVIVFDPRSRTEQSYDYVRFYKDSTKVGQWGQDKYSGNEFPGMNGTDPLRIPADSCVLSFHSDGSNNDWGYLIEVTGVISGKCDVPIRQIDSKLAQKRFVQFLGVKMQSNVLSHLFSKFTTIKTEKENIWNKEFLSNLLQYYLSYHIVNTLEKSTIPNIYLKNKCNDFISVTYDKYNKTNSLICFQLYQAMFNNNFKADINDFYNSDNLSNNFSSVLYEMIKKSITFNEHSVNYDNVLLNFNRKVIKSQLIFQLSQSVLPSFHTPSDKINNSESVRTNSFENPLEHIIRSSNDRGIPYKLKCLGVTIHCRIRAGPSMQTSKVGDFANGSVVFMSGKVNDFLRLADGRGYVISFIEGGISWEKCHKNEDLSFVVSTKDKFDKQNALNQLSGLYLNYLRESIKDETYFLLCLIISNWPKEITLEIDEKLMFLLLRISGISKENDKDQTNNVNLDSSLLYFSIRSLLLRGKHCNIINESFITCLSKISIDSFTLPIVELSSKQSSGNKTLPNDIVNIASVNLPDIFEEPKYLVFESKHQYGNNENTFIKVHIPNVKGLEFIFDEECSTERNYDYVAIYQDEKKTRMLGGKYSGRKTGENNWPGVNENPSLIIRDKNTCWLNFISDGTNVDWGWKVTVYPYNGDDENEEESLYSIPKEQADFELVLRPFNTNNTKIFTYLPSNVIEKVKYCDGSISMGIQLFEMICNTNNIIEYLVDNSSGYELLSRFCSCIYIISSNNSNIIIKYLRSYIKILYSFHNYISNGNKFYVSRLDVEKLLNNTSYTIISLANDAFSHADTSNTKKAATIHNVLKLALGQAAVAASFCSNNLVQSSRNIICDTFSYPDIYLCSSLQLTAQGRGIKLFDSNVRNSTQNFAALGPLYPDIYISSTKSSLTTSNIELNDKLVMKYPYNHTHYVKIFCPKSNNKESSTGYFSVGLVLFSPIIYQDSNYAFNEMDSIKIDFSMTSDDITMGVSRLSMTSLKDEDNVKRTESWVPKIFRRGFNLSSNSNSKELSNDEVGNHCFSSVRNGDIVGVTVSVDQSKKWSIIFTRNDIIIYNIIGKESIDKLFNIKSDNKLKLLDSCCLSLYVSIPCDCNYTALFLNSNETSPVTLSRISNTSTSDDNKAKKLMTIDDVNIFSNDLTLNKADGIITCLSNKVESTLQNLLVHVTDNCCFTIQLISYPDEDVQFSFGLTKSLISSSLLYGFGNSEDSVGLCDNMKDHDNSVILNNKNQMKSFRKIKELDILCISYNKMAGKAWLYCNNDCVQDFVIHPPGITCTLYIGVIFYKHCAIKILDSPEPLQPVTFSQISLEDSPKSSRSSSESHLSMSSNDSESSRNPTTTDENSSATNEPMYIISKWNTAISQSELEFSNNNMTVKRPGGVSCYPAALVKVPEDCLQCKFTVVIEAAPTANNTLSWGIAASPFPTSGHKAFGEMEGSWGLYNNRLDNNDTKIFADGQLVESFRRLTEGDVLTITYRKLSSNVQTAELIINNNEYSCMFNLSNTISEWVIGSTLCNDHVLTVQLANQINNTSNTTTVSSTATAVSPIKKDLAPDIVIDSTNKRKITSIIDEYNKDSFLNYMYKRKNYFYSNVDKYSIMDDDFDQYASKVFKKQFSKSANYVMESLFIDSQLDSLHHTIQPLAKVNGLLRYLIDDDITGTSRLPSNNCSTIIPTSYLLKKLPIRSIISQIQIVPIKDIVNKQHNVKVTGAIGYAFKIIHKGSMDSNKVKEIYRVNTSYSISNDYMNIHQDNVMKSNEIILSDFTSLKSKQFVEKLYNDFEIIYEQSASNGSAMITTQANVNNTNFSIGDIVIRKSLKIQSQVSTNNFPCLGELGDVIDVSIDYILIYWRSSLQLEKYYQSEIDLYINLYQSIDITKNNFIFSPFLTDSFDISVNKIDTETGESIIDLSNISIDENTYLIVVPLLSLDSLVRSPIYSDIRNKIFLSFGKYLVSGFNIDLDNNNNEVVKVQKIPYNFDKIIELSKINVRRIDKAIVCYIDELAKEKSWNEATILSKAWEEIAPSTINGFSKYPILLAICNDAIRNDHINDYQPANLDYLKYRFVLITLLNYEIKKCFDYIDFEDIDNNNLNGNQNKILCYLSDLLLKGRSLILYTFKASYIQKLLGKSESSASKFELIISRSRSLKYKSKGEIDNEGKWSVFGQTFRQLNTLPVASLRRSGQVWQTVFAGERAQDAGGPYREVWSAMTEDLLSNYLPLLLPSPNAIDNTGIRSEAYIVNPDCILKSIHTEMLTFLGKLMGIAIRTSNYMDITLAPIVWKLIINDTITIDDIRTIDLFTVTNIENLRSRKGISEHDFYEKFEGFFFTIKNLAGREVELIANGKNIPLEWNNVDQYCDLLEEFRKNEMKDACNAIRSGIITQIPPVFLTLLTWEQIEEMVCGQPIIDLTLLKSITEYSGCNESDQHILWFWDILENSFSHEDRKAFIRFAWGRTRLPLNKAGFSNNLKIQNLSSSPPDIYLPESHTCFFTVDLPRYSSKDIMLRKLTYAVHHCTAIDGDGTSSSMRAGDMLWEE